MRDEANTAARRRGRHGLAVVALVAAGLFVLVYRQVLGVTQRPSWPPPPDAVTPAGAEAATREFAARTRDAAARCRTRLRVVDGGDDRAVGRGSELLPPHLQGHRRCAVVRPHPHVRLARRLRRDADGRIAEAKDGGGNRSAGDRGRLRLQTSRRGAGDVHAARSIWGADRRQRRIPSRPGRPLPGRPAHRLASGRSGSR